MRGSRPSCCARLRNLSQSNRARLDSGRRGLGQYHGKSSRRWLNTHFLRYYTEGPSAQNPNSLCDAAERSHKPGWSFHHSWFFNHSSASSASSTGVLTEKTSAELLVAPTSLICRRVPVEIALGAGKSNAVTNRRAIALMAQACRRVGAPSGRCVDHWFLSCRHGRPRSRGKTFLHD